MDLLNVEKPARYMGGEMGSVIKPEASFRIALAFPDVYEVGMSHLGLRILYNIINRMDGVAAERVYAPWPDMADQMQDSAIPLSTLETSTPLASTDIIGFTLQYELSCSNILAMLKLSGIPLQSADRDASWPLVIGGGPGAFNPEPLAPFFDAFLVGDGEEAVLEIAAIVKGWKQKPDKNKEELLDLLSGVEGIYIPSRFAVSYKDDGTIEAITPLKPEAPGVRRRFLADLETAPYPEEQVIPFMKTIHDRVAIEVARGCTRGCRFCQAGYIYRPLRERSQEKIHYLAGKALAASGYDEISLLSLSTGDHSCIASLLHQLMNDYADNRVAVSLPSLRVGTLTQELIDQIKRVRKTGFTLAPEAGSERLRKVINKGIAAEDLLESALQAYSAGWRLIKLYFMMGLPTEEREDLLAIAALARQVKDQAKKSGGQGEVNVAVSTFVPKPHTPFQWERQISLREIRDNIRLMKDELKRRKLNFKYQEPELSFLEGVIARGDRRLGPVIQRAVELGCRFDGWREHFSLDLWLKAFDDCNVDPEWYLRERNIDEILPWSHIDSGVSSEFLLKEREFAREALATEDCREGACSACGVCDFNRIKNRLAVPPNPDGNPESDTVPATDPAASRIRIRFSKTGQMRYLSHLELINFFTRAVHRAGVPILYSHGFHPHPRFSFATATSVGIESTAEYLDLFVSPISADEVKRRLNRVMPSGMEVISAEQIDMKAPSLSPLIHATRYRLHLSQCTSDQLSEQCVQFMAHSSWNLTRVKKNKPEQSFDLRQEVLELTSDGPVMQMLLGRGKPSEVAAAVTGLPVEIFRDCRIEKTDVIFMDK